MGWNHRVLAWEHKGEVTFQIHEVYYDDSGVPNGYTKEAIAVGGEKIGDLKWQLRKMKKCLKKPILWAGEKWPQEFSTAPPKTKSGDG